MIIKDVLTKYSVHFLSYTSYYLGPKCVGNYLEPLSVIISREQVSFCEGQTSLCGFKRILKSLSARKYLLHALLGASRGLCNGAEKC